MIDINSAIPNILAKIKKIPVGHYLELLTFKKDRSVRVIKKSEDKLLVIQNGYEQNQFIIESAKIKKTLKVLLKKEFPRSNKAHIKSGIEER